MCPIAVDAHVQCVLRLGLPLLLTCTLVAAATWYMLGEDSTAWRTEGFHLGGGTQDSTCLKAFSSPSLLINDMLRTAIQWKPHPVLLLILLKTLPRVTPACTSPGKGLGTLGLTPPLRCILATQLTAPCCAALGLGGNNTTAALQQNKTVEIKQLFNFEIL